MIATVALLVVIAASAAAWRPARARLSSAWDLGPFAAPVVIVGLALSLFLVITSAVGRAAGRLDAGLVASALVFAAGAGRLLTLPKLRVEARRASVREQLVVALAVGTGVIAHAAFALRHQRHDERSVFSHATMVAQLARGAYPPWFPPFPQHEARYHHGFDLLWGRSPEASASPPTPPSTPLR